MNQDQFTSLIQSLIKIAGSALTAHGLTAAANIVNGQDVSGVVLVVAGLVWSHVWNAAPTTTPPTTPTK